MFCFFGGLVYLNVCYICFFVNEIEYLGNIMTDAEYGMLGIVSAENVCFVA